MLTVCARYINVLRQATRRMKEKKTRVAMYALEV